MDRLWTKVIDASRYLGSWEIKAKGVCNTHLKDSMLYPYNTGRLNELLKE